MENKSLNPSQTVFEQIKRTGETKNEYWTARDLSTVLEYSEYRHFKPVIDRAKTLAKTAATGLPTISRISSVWFPSAQVPNEKLMM